MFTDRFWILKAALAFGAFVLVCRASERDFHALQPDIERTTYEAERIAGRETLLWAETVTAVHADGFSFATKAGPVRALSPLRPKVGDRIHGVARFTERPRVVEVARARVMEGFRWKRGLNYGLSSLCVIAYLWLIRRRFRWSPERGLFRSRY